MNTFFGVALTALVLLAPALSDAASVAQTAGQPQSSATASATYAQQHPYAYFDYQNGIHVMPVSPVAGVRGAARPVLQDGTAALMNQTGNGP